ncbi:MAG: hypothetical protein ABSF69_29320, partial [Polyangiaceae bacterium]
MTRIKICGVTSVEQALACVELGADAIGINFVASSPRRVDVATGRAIAQRVGSRALVVAVVADMAVDAMRTLRDQTGAGCLQLHGDQGTWFGHQHGDSHVRSAQGRHFDGDLGGAVVGPGMGEGVQAVARIVARLVDLDLPNFEYVYPDLAIHRRQQHRGRIDRLCSSRGAEHLKLRYRTALSVDDIEIGGGTVRAGKAHYG